MSTPEEKPLPQTASSHSDTWGHLRQFTAARIALGRTGGSQTTRAVLDFRLSHARARDAVQKPFEFSALLAELNQAAVPACLAASQVRDRAAHLLRPDLGRSLDEPSRLRLQELAESFGPCDLVVIVSDGLAACAAERHAVNTLVPLLKTLGAAGWRVAPVIVVPYARVKLQDEIGSLFSARYSLMLLGERPGLGTPDSLGAYFTAKPGPARTDADRNCVSNIREEGLPPAQAAAKLAWLLQESSRTGLFGIQLKDTGPALALKVHAAGNWQEGRHPDVIGR